MTAPLLQSLVTMPIRSCRGLLLLLILSGIDARQDLAAQTATKVHAPEASYRAPAEMRGTGPGGATLRCADGSHPAPMAPASACATRGGVLFRYPLRTSPTASGAGGEATEIPVPPAARARTTSGATTHRADAARGDTPRRAPRPPSDATLLCDDGTFIRADSASARCAAHGGVKLRFVRRGS